MATPRFTLTWANAGCQSDTPAKMPTATNTRPTRRMLDIAVLHLNKRSVGGIRAELPAPKLSHNERRTGKRNPPVTTNVGSPEFAVSGAEHPGHRRDLFPELTRRSLPRSDSLHCPCPFLRE